MTASAHAAANNATGRRRRLAFLALLLLLLVLVGAAACAHRDRSDDGPTTPGNGSGSGGSGTGLVVATSPATGDLLTPGGAAQTIAFTVTNPAADSRILSSVSVRIANTNGTPWLSAGCSATDYTVSVPAVAYGQIEPAGVASGTVQIRMNNLATNQDHCKNTTVPLRFVTS